MIEVYLTLNGNAKEAAEYYANVFGADAPYIMTADQMPKEENEEMQFPPDFVVYSHVETFAGNIMMSDCIPGEEVTPNDSVWISVTDPDADKLHRVFDALAKDGDVLMALEPTFFSPLYGQLKDKFGFHWMLMLPDEEVES